MLGIIVGVILVFFLRAQMIVEARKSRTNPKPYIYATILLDIIMSLVSWSGRPFTTMLLIASLFVPYIVLSSKPFTPNPPDLDLSDHLIR